MNSNDITKSLDDRKVFKSFRVQNNKNCVISVVATVKSIVTKTGVYNLQRANISILNSFCKEKWHQ